MNLLSQNLRALTACVLLLGLLPPCVRAANPPPAADPAVGALTLEAARTPSPPLAADAPAPQSESTAFQVKETLRRFRA